MSKNVVVIGSGIGGLSAAAALAKKGYKVKVLEESHVIGGYCQSFKRKGFKFITSVHKIGVKESVNSINKFIQLLTDHDSNITWKNFDEYHIFDDKRVDQGAENIEDNLIEYFPNEKRAINRFFTDFRRLNEIMLKVYENNNSISKLSIDEARYYLGFVKKKVGFILDEYFNEKLLKDIILSSIEIDKESISLTILPALFERKFAGKFYVPENGMDQVLEVLKKVIYDNEGQILTNKKVEKILIENNSVRGVIAGEESFQCDYIVSGIDIWKTYNDLIGTDYISQDYIDKLDKKWPVTKSCYGLWLGLDCPIEEIGMSGECVFYYPDIDNGIEIKELLTKENGKILDNFPIMVNSSFSKHEGCTPKGKSQLSIGFLTEYTLEENWGVEHGKRGHKYRETKEIVTEKVIKVLEKMLPNIRDHIEVIISATPITFERYSGNRRGAYCGYGKKVEYFLDASKPKNHTSIDGLYCSSHWVAMQGGVIHTFLQGFNTANLILKNEKRSDLYMDGNLKNSEDMAI